MKVAFLDSCNCDWGCPCQFNANPTHGNCEGITAIHIRTGNYGTLKLDRLNIAMMGAWPGAIHKGHGKASFYVDEHADNDQFDALAKILTGVAGGGPFEIFASTLDDYQYPQRARITFSPKGLRSRARIEDALDVQLEPMKNPVTGKVHRAVIELPAGFEAKRMNLASSKKLVVNDGYLKYKHFGTYASFQESTWKGP